MKNKQTLPADLTQEEYENYPFTWFQRNVLWIIGSGLLIGIGIVIYLIK